MKTFSSVRLARESIEVPRKRDVVLDAGWRQGAKKEEKMCTNLHYTREGFTPGLKKTELYHRERTIPPSVFYTGIRARLFGGVARRGEGSESGRSPT